MPTRPADLETELLDDSSRSTLRVRAVHLEVIEGPDAGLRARIERPTTFVVGTGTSADLSLSDTTVSREHLRLTLAEEGALVRDPGSTNGTFIGDLKIREVTLGADAVLRLGATTIKVHVESVPVDVPVSSGTAFGGASGWSTAMRHIFAMLEKAAPAELTVLLEGESGVGKEVLASAVHAASGRADGPFVVVDCGAIPPGLIESELFGHERGAFTGADRPRIGAFEQADGGTIFLDEVGELPLDLQPKLLRFLETRELRPVGGSAVRPVNTRVIAATNRNLAEAARKGEFRRDLFYRLAIVRVTIPPLRDRRDDIARLALRFLRAIPGRERDELPPDLASMLTAYDWPGNVRELRNAVERYAVLGIHGALADSAEPGVRAEGVGDLSGLPYHEARRRALDRFERDYLTGLLDRTDHVVTRAAELGQLSRASIHRMLLRIRGGPVRDEP